MASARPRVSVIIPVFNDAAGLAQCLDHIARQSYPAELTEVLVVDNGSAEDIAPVVRAHLPAARLLRESRPGSYAARNRALQEATGDVLAFTDADCWPEEDWLKCGVARLSGDPALGLVAGHVELVPRDPRRPTGAELYDMTYALRQRDYLEKQHFGATANLFTRRPVIAAVGPFDAALKSRGDYEWGRRVHAAGHGQVYAPEVVVRHPARGTLRAMAAKARRQRGGLVAVGDISPAWGNRLWRWANHLLPIKPGADVRAAARRFGRLAALRFYGAIYYRRLVVMAEEVRLALGGKARR